MGVVKFLAILLICAAAPAASLRYWVQPCTDPESRCQPGDPELAAWALQAWQAASEGKLTLDKTEDLEGAHIRIYWATANQGLYGEARPILVNGVQGAEVYVLPGIVPKGEKDLLLRDAIVYLTCLHETGHALGLSHTAKFADIMYSFQHGGDIDEYFNRYRRLLKSRDDIQKHWGMSEEDRKRFAVVVDKIRVKP